MGHGVTRIQAEVHNDLLNLAPVSFQGKRVLPQVCPDFDLAVEGLGYDLQHIADDIIDVDLPDHIFSFSRQNRAAA